MSRFTHCFIIDNQASSQAEQSKAYIDELQAHFGNNAARYTLQSADFDNDSRLLSFLRPATADDLITILGGDGTLNYVVNSLLAQGGPSAKATILPIWAGNANDIAHMLNGKPVQELKPLLATGERKPSYPLSVGFGDVQHLALAYVSFGATAHAMQAIERNDEKTNLWREITVGFKAMWQADRFAASRGKQYYEIIVVNGSRVAKLYRTKSSLTTPTVTQISLRYKHPVLIGHLFKWVLSLVRQNRALEPLDFTLKTNVPAQIDGDLHQLTAGTRVTVSQSTEPYYVLTTRE